MAETKKMAETPALEKKWYQKIPNAFVILFFILIFVGVLTYIVPSGAFDTIKMDNGRMGVVPGSFHYIEKTSAMTVSPWDIFKSIPKGMVEAASVMMIVFMAGGMFGILGETKVIENSLGIAVQKIEKHKISKSWTLILLTYIFGFFGAAVGYENLIPFVPIGVMVALGLGFDIMVGAAVVVGGISVGFATSPINPYTVGVADQIAGLPMFSGIGLRTIFCILSVAVLCHHTIRYTKRITKDPSKSLVLGIDTHGLSIDKAQVDAYTMNGRDKIILGIFLSFIVAVVLGVIKYKWYIGEISALFVLYAIVIGLVARFNSDKILKSFIDGAAGLTGGALIIGFARAIQVLLTQGQIGDTIINSLSAPLANFAPVVSAILMTIVQGLINFLIPSGSGQAMATMPIMIPLSDIIGVSRQVAILAFQIGDGITNMMVPTLGGLLAMLAIARVPFDKWVRFIFPLILKLYLLGWVFLAIGVAINWQ